MIASLLFTLSCIADPTKMCATDFEPVCVNGTEFSNLCHAEAAGFYGKCGTEVIAGPCSKATAYPNVVSCSSEMFLSEKTGRCVTKPWSDFLSCDEEKRQGACANGADPNPWVAEHCSRTCSI